MKMSKCSCSSVAVVLSTAGYEVKVNAACKGEAEHQEKGGDAI